MSGRRWPPEAPLLSARSSTAVGSSSFLDSPRSSTTGWYRHPKKPPRSARLHTPIPAIPSVDLAWGYDIYEDGQLEFMKPPKTPGDPRGPGSYSPTTAMTMRRGPSVDFSRVSGRDDVPAERRPADDWVAGMAEEYEFKSGMFMGDTIVPPRQPMPIAANVLRTPRSQRSLESQELAFPPPSPGPGDFELSRKLTRPVVAKFPRQVRYHARPALAPLPPLRRSPRNVHVRSPRNAGDVGLSVRRQDLKTAWRPPALLQGTARDPLAFDFWAVDPTPASTPEAAKGRDEGPKLSNAAARRQALADAWDGRDYPPGLSERERKLWRAFCTADLDFDGSVSRKELFEALRCAGVSERMGTKGLADAFRLADSNDDAQIDWEEFLHLAKLMPELALEDFRQSW